MIKQHEELKWLHVSKKDFERNKKVAEKYPDYDTRYVVCLSEHSGHILELHGYELGKPPKYEAWYIYSKNSKGAGKAKEKIAWFYTDELQDILGETSDLHERVLAK